MWPKFSAEKQEKPALQLYLEPLTSPENGEANLRKRSCPKTIICLKLFAVVISCLLFCISLYLVMLHMAHCARWNDASNDPQYAQFYEKYALQFNGEGERNNEFIKNMFIEIYDGEYDVPENFEEYRQRYKEFLRKYGKSYLPAEEEYRFRVYVHNVIAYELEESKTPWMDYDDTQFTDMTDAELKKMLVSGGDFPSMEGVSRFEEPLYQEREGRPQEVDWRGSGKVTAIKNQLQCGSCWAFAVVAAVEAQYAIKKNKTAILSEQQLVDCDGKNNGCHGGYRPYAMSYIVSNGLYPSSSYPYLATEKNECKVLNETKVFINDYKVLSTNEETQADWIAQNGPLTFGMKVIKQMYSYRSGVFEPAREDCETKSLGSHAMTIVGYGSENGRDFWIVKNSWGSYWGQSGYFKLARGVNACDAAENVVAPIIN